MIHDAQLDYYGRRLATASSDRTVRVFDVVGDTHRVSAELRGHEGPVWEVAWAHPKFGGLLASCAYDRRVIVWREGAAGGANAAAAAAAGVNGAPDSQWDKVYEFSGHESSVNSVSWAPHEYGLQFACASSDGYVSVVSSKADGVWDVTKFKAHQVGCNAVCWAPAVAAGALVTPAQQQPGGANALAAPKRLVSCGCDNLVKVWRFNDAENQWVVEDVLEGHADWVRDVAWAPSVGLASATIASCSQDATCVIWTKEDGSSTWTRKQLPKFNDVLWRVSWSITGNILAVSAGDNKVTLWKESLEGEWTCLSDVNEADGAPGGPQ